MMATYRLLFFVAKRIPFADFSVSLRPTPHCLVPHKSRQSQWAQARRAWRHRPDGRYGVALQALGDLGFVMQKIQDNNI